MTRSELTRRGFLGAATGSLALSLRQAKADADDRPPVTDPRATDGDERSEPDWDERLTITVGPEGQDADLVGRDDKVIQAALGYVARLGGGTVRLLPGTYTLRHPVVLPSRVRLVGSGAETIITKIPSRTVGAGRRLRLVRPGDHARGRPGLPGRRRRRAPRQEPGRRRRRSSSSGRSSPARATGSSSTPASARTSGSPASRPARRCSRC